MLSRKLQGWSEEPRDRYNRDEPDDRDSTPQEEHGSPVRRILRGVLWGFVIFLLLGAAIVVHRVLDTTYGTPIETVLTDDSIPIRTTVPEFAARAATLASTDLRPGNSVEILTETDVFDRMLADISGAERSITLMGYSCGAGLLGGTLAEALIEKARSGVRVAFLGDGFGCRGLLRRLDEPLEASGAEVASFRPVRWFTLHRAQHRLHARSVVIDGEVGYTGGFGFDDKWVIDQRGESMWRDTSVRVTGPAVSEIQAAFLTAWAEATGDLLFANDFLPPSPELGEGGVVAGLLRSTPAIGSTAAERFLAVTLAGVDSTLYISNSYFVPTRLMRGLLADAARRGVDVRLLLPGEKTDVPATRYVARRHYEELLVSGVRIYEYQPSMMHAKTIVADGRWMAVGSINLDNRSIRLNEEASFLAWDAQLGAAMDSLFMADLANAREISLAEHQQRPYAERIKERLYALVAPLL